MMLPYNFFKEKYVYSDTLGSILIFMHCCLLFYFFFSLPKIKPFNYIILYNNRKCQESSHMVFEGSVMSLN